MACYLQAIPVSAPWPRYLLRELETLKYQNTVGRSWKTPVNDLQPPSLPMVHDRLHELPPEILQIIQQHILDDSRHDFVASLSISHAWAASAAQLLWRDVILDPSNISSFSAAVALNSSLARLVHSLTFELTLPPDFTFRPTDEKELVEVVRLLPNLRTFSFAGSPDADVQSPVNNVFIQDLLLSFSASLSSLNIDINSLKSRGRSKYHTCDLIQRLLPQLEHLRLKGLVCCQDLFREVPHCPNLKSIIINDSRRSYLAVCKRISSELWRSDYVGETMARAARKTVEGGRMPKLQICNVLVMSDRGSDQDDASNISTEIDLMAEDDADRYTCIQSKDILADRSICYPLVQSSNTGDLWLFGEVSNEQIMVLKWQTFQGITEFIELLTPTWSKDGNGHQRPPDPSRYTSSRLENCLSRQHELSLNCDNELRTQTGIGSSQWTLMHYDRIMNPSIHVGLGRGSFVNRQNYHQQGAILVENSLVER